jgi:hypothetical protein
MTDEQEKTFKRDVVESLNKLKGRSQQSVPEIRQLIKTSDVVETARKIIDQKNIEWISDGLKKLANANLPRAIIKQAVIDFQLKDLFAKAEELVAKANLTFANIFSKDAPPTETSTNETSSNETPSKKARLKKTPSKKKTKRSSNER